MFHLLRSWGGVARANVGGRWLSECIREHKCKYKYVCICISNILLIILYDININNIISYYNIALCIVLLGPSMISKYLDEWEI